MNQMNKLRWAVIAASLLSGSALAAVVNCEVTPKNSVIADGQTLQLGATCTGGSLSSISLLMDGTSVSDNVSLSGHQAGETVYFTAPIGLGANGADEFLFSVTGVPTSGNTWGSSTEAKVVVKSSGSAVAQALGIANPTTSVDATCGTANNTTVASLPSNGALCTSGSKPALVVSGPTSYSWSCLSLTGGAEANCYATRSVSYTVTTSVSGSGGTMATPSQSVAGGSTLLVTAVPSGTNNTSWSGTCGGTPTGNTFTTNAVTGNCTVVASFSAAPPVINGSCGSSNDGSFTTAPTTNLCSAGTQSGVTTNTSTYTWSCTGSNGGSTAPCSATRTITGGGGSGGDTGVGSGLWQPSGMSNRTVADIAGLPGATVGYVPGCLNGGSANAHYSGCAANSSFTGTLADTGAAHTFSFGTGRQLVLRYRSKATAGTSFKIALRVNSDTGATALPTTVRVWLSTSPTATYDSVSPACRTSSSYAAYIKTGPGFCPVTPNTLYYYGIEYDAASSYRFIIDQTGSEFY